VKTTYLPPITLDHTLDTPLYRQLFDRLRDAILRGQLQPGQAIPSTRSLASHLCISREPVLVAFELLHAEGYIESRVGARTRITTALPERIARQVVNQAGEAARPKRGPRTIGGGQLERIWNPDDPWWSQTRAFRVGVPDVRHFPTAVWSSLLSRHARTQMPATMGSMGYLPLRIAIANYLRMARDVHCVPEQIMIVSGAQHGLQIATRVLLGRGDAVWMEDPGYRGASGALKFAGATLVPVPVDDAGMNVTEGMRRKHRARAAYVTPSHQFPMGCTMSVSRRLMLLDWASRNDAWILEDDYDSEFRFAGQPISSLQSLDTDARVVYIGSFSKVFSPGLRIGYMVIPMDLVAPFRATRQAIDISSPTLSQLAMADFMQNGHFARHIRHLKQIYSGRRKAFIEAIQQHIGSDMRVAGTVAGLHLVGLLPAGSNDVLVAHRLAEAGISAIPLSSCYLEPGGEAGLVLGYANVEVEEIRAATKLLAAVLRQERSRSGTH
jgi:GntR family transcriptional regulator/MocR family aminotransferase